MSYKTVNPVDLSPYYREFPDETNVMPAYMFEGVVHDYFHKPNFSGGACLPWSKVSNKFLIRAGETTVWAGYNGSGKSLLTGQIALGLMQQGHRICIASMEMRPEITIARMCRQASQTNVPSPDFIKRFHQWLDGKLWLYVQQNTVKSETVVALSRYCGTGVREAGKKLPINHLFVDSLMKCGINVDDYNRQKGFVDQLDSVAKDTGIHIHLIAHMRKGDTEFREGDKMDVKGASEITDQACNVMILWRNKEKEDELQKANPNEKVLSMPDAILSCRKQRNGEWEGKIGLHFDKASQQYVGFEGADAIDFLKPYAVAA